MASVDHGDESSPSSSGPASALAFLGAISGHRETALAIVNGLFGDSLERRGSNLATEMSIRHGTTELPLDRQALADTLGASDEPVDGRICILVHGLMSNETIWAYPGDRATTYGTELANDHGVTTLSLRYNTGRHISTNGRDLAQLINELVRVWPVRVREINLVGHSMGGLVIRSACHYGRRARPLGRWLPFGRRWTTKVRRVVLIGVPNDGAGLEHLVNSASAALATIPASAIRLLGRGLDRRSDGIKDLRFGNIVDEDWASAHPRATVRSHPHRPTELRGADHLVVAGSITGDPEHPIARLLGDALVTAASATGSVADIVLFPDATTRMFPKVTHNALAHHADVYDAITRWW